MNLANIEMILKIILLALKIAILVKYIIESKKHKKTVAALAKISDVNNIILNL